MEQRLNFSLIFFLFFLLIALTVLEGAIYQERVKAGLVSTALPLKAGQNTWKFLGSLRTVAAAYLWLRVDRIHHEYYGDLTREQELVPYYRIITWLDPRWVDAYYVGSYLLYLYKQPEESLKFAEEGVRLNPNSAKLNFNLGQLYVLTKNYSQSLPYLNKALSLTRDKREKFLVYQLLYVAYKNLGEKDKARKVLKNINLLKEEFQKEATKRK
jgi:tetratricopeptide (TPR) repeat protein